MFGSNIFDGVVVLCNLLNCVGCFDAIQRCPILCFEEYGNCAIHESTHRELWPLLRPGNDRK